MKTDSGYVLGLITDNTAASVDEINRRIKTTESANPDTREPATDILHIASNSLAHRFFKSFPILEQAAHTIAESQEFDDALDSYRSSHRKLVDSLVETVSTSADLSRAQLLNLQERLWRIALSLEIDAELKSLAKSHANEEAATEQAEHAMALSTVLQTCHALETSLLARFDVESDEYDYANETTAAYSMMLSAMVFHLDELLRLDSFNYDLLPDMDWAEETLRSPRGINTPASLYMRLLFKELVDAGDEKESPDMPMSSFFLDYCEFGKALGDQGFYCSSILVLEQYWRAYKEGILSAMPCEPASVFGASLLQAGRTEFAVSVLSSILYDTDWEDDRLNAESLSDEDLPVSEWVYHLGHSTWLYRAHCNLATGLGVLARDYQQAALACASPIAFESASSNPHATAARALRDIAIKETEAASSLDANRKAAPLIRAALKHDEYIASAPTFGVTAQRALRSSYELLRSICPEDSISRSNGLLELQYVDIALDYLGECAELGTRAGSKSTFASPDNFQAWFLSRFQEIAKVWIRNRRRVGQKASMRSDTNAIIETYTRILHRPTRIKGKAFAALSSLLLIRLRSLKIKRSLLCRFDDNERLARRVSDKNPLLACLKQEYWGDTAAKALRAIKRIRSVSNEESCSADIVYYTSTKNACRLFEDLYYPELADYPCSKERCRSAQIPDEDLGPARNCLTLMHASYMNDPSEGSALFKVFESNWKGDLFKHTASEFRDLVFGESFVFIKSFSCCSDQLHMWSMYGRGSDGQDSAGCCVGFSNQMFQEGPSPFIDLWLIDTHGVCILSALKAPDDLDLYQIAYIENSEGRYRFTNGGKSNDRGILSESVEAIGKAIQSIESIPGEKEKKKENEDLIIKLLAPILFLFKDSSYYREEELRLIITRDPTSAGRSEICPIERPNATPLYCVKPFKQVYIDKVILGPKASDAHIVIPHIQYELARICDKAEKNGVRLSPSVFKSKIPYR